MRKLCKTFMLVALAALTFGGMPAAEERGTVRQMRGTFIRLVEQRVDEQGYLGVVIKPLESDDHVTVLIPRENEDLRVAARQLREGQTLGIAFASEGPNNWLRRMEAGRPRERAQEQVEGQRRPAEGDIRRDPGQVRESPEARRDQAIRGTEDQARFRPRPPQEGVGLVPGPDPMEGQIREIVARHAEQMGRAFREVLRVHQDRMQAELRELRNRAERMERELQELRAENERLRMQLRNRNEPGIERQRAPRERTELQRRREGRQIEEGEQQEDRGPREEPAPSPR